MLFLLEYLPYFARDARCARGHSMSKKYSRKGASRRNANTSKIKPYIFYLLPLFCVILIMPLLVRASVFDNTLIGEVGYGNSPKLVDVFLVCKQHFFYVVMGLTGFCMLCFILLERYIFSFKKWMLPLEIYAFMGIVSTIFSKNSWSSMKGVDQMFQSLPVLLGYLLLFFYTYSVFSREEKEYSGALSCFVRVFAVGAFLLDFVGIMQLVGSDPLQWGWVKTLTGLKNAEFVSSNRIYMTLFHQDYAGVYLAMVIPVLLAGFFMEQKKVWKVFMGISICSSVVCLFGTQSRSSIASLIIATVLVLAVFVFQRDVPKETKKRLLSGAGIMLFVLIVAFVAVNIFQDNSLSNRVLNYKNKIRVTKLESVETKKDGIQIGYNKEKIKLTWDDEVTKIQCSSNTLKPKAGVTKDASGAEQKGVILKLDKKSWFFAKGEDGKYYCLDDSGNWVSSISSEDALSTASYGLAAYRGFVWSKSIPLLKKTLVIGAGPDQFIRLFPNNDYASKYISRQDHTIYNKPHSWYLQMGIETGVISMLSMCVFLVLLMLQIWKKSVADTKKANPAVSVSIKLLFIIAVLAYLITACFNDSMLVTAPLFWIILGIAASFDV